MAVSNVQRLTRGDRKYAAKKKSANVQEVKFDPESRNDYLTGFHKRKLARQAEGRRKAEELNRQQRLEERRKIREERRGEINKGLEKLKEAERIIGTSDADATGRPGARLNVPGENKGSESRTTGENEDSDEFEGFQENSGILKRHNVAIGDSNVTFEEVNLDPYVDVSRSEQVLDEATRKANEYAAYVASLETAEAEAKKKKAKQSKKKFRYLPKSERMLLNSKKRVR